MNIKKAISLINDKNTTIEKVCIFITNDVMEYQNKRENFYIQEFKEQCELQFITPENDLYTRAAEKITHNIDKDTQKFIIKYTDLAIDALLDSYNNKKITSKNGFNNFLSILTALKAEHETTK
jgi:hypothetical protein